MKILHLIPDLDYSGPARQLTLLARALPAARFEQCVGVLSRAEGESPTLRQAGVRVEELGWTRWFDPRPLWRLRQLLRSFNPDLVHAWQQPALRALAVVGRPDVPRIVSRPLPPFTAALSRLDRWLLTRADRVCVRTVGEAERCRQAGVPAERLALVPPAVEAADLDGLEDLSSEWLPGPEQRLLLCPGRLQPGRGFRDAMWAFDVLRYLYDDLKLLILGDGPERGKLEEFRDKLGLKEVLFAGHRPDVRPAQARARVVWVPSLADRGCTVALEAMAAGRPVIASRVGALAEVVVEGETGFLVPPGDKVALARQTRRLLEDPARAQQMGEAARRWVACNYSVAELAARITALYDNGLP
jgi:glycosyltransferase involved in cell wall biosynthesis